MLYLLIVYLIKAEIHIITKCGALADDVLWNENLQPTRYSTKN